MQAGLADNPPVFVLGGNIVPLGPPGTNTTTALRAGNLTLLVAFPSADSPPFERCGGGCGSQNGVGNRVTCGHMYLDQGKLPLPDASAVDARLHACFHALLLVAALHATEVRHDAVLISG